MRKPTLKAAKSGDPTYWENLDDCLAMARRLESVGLPWVVVARGQIYSLTCLNSGFVALLPESARPCVE